MRGILIILVLLAAGIALWFWWTGAPVKPTLEHAKDEAQQAVHTAAEKVAEKTAQPVTVPAPSGAAFAVMPLGDSGK